MDMFSYKHKEKDLIVKEDSAFNYTPSIDNVLKYDENLVIDFDANRTLANKVKNKLNQKLVKKQIKGINPIFNPELVKALQIFHDYIETRVPGYPPYITKGEDGKLDISIRAYVDAKEFLSNEYDLDVETLILSGENGYHNVEKIHVGKYTITEDGYVKKGKEIIFRPGKPEDHKVTKIDFTKNNITIQNTKIESTETDVTTESTKIESTETDVTTESTKIEPTEGDITTESTKIESTEIDVTIQSPEYIFEISMERLKDVGSFKDFFINKNEFITLEEKYDLETNGGVIEFEDLTAKDLVILMNIEKYPDKVAAAITAADKWNEEGTDTNLAFTNCNFGKINFMYLTFLLILGGGTAGVAPLAASKLAVFTSGNRKGCKRITKVTGHFMMYSTTNPVGMPSSLIQKFYKFFESIGLFKANVYIFMAKGSIINIKKFIKVKFPGSDWVMFQMCIGGLLEHFLVNFQSWVTEEINKMDCVSVTKKVSVGSESVEFVQTEDTTGAKKVVMPDEEGEGAKGRAGIVGSLDSGSTANSKRPATEREANAYNYCMMFYKDIFDYMNIKDIDDANQYLTDNFGPESSFQSGLNDLEGVSTVSYDTFKANMKAEDNTIIINKLNDDVFQISNFVYLEDYNSILAKVRILYTSTFVPTENATLAALKTIAQMATDDAATEKAEFDGKINSYINEFSEQMIDTLDSKAKNTSKAWYHPEFLDTFMGHVKAITNTLATKISTPTKREFDIETNSIKRFINEKHGGTTSDTDPFPNLPTEEQEDILNFDAPTYLSPSGYSTVNQYIPGNVTFSWRAASNLYGGEFKVVLYSDPTLESENFIVATKSGSEINSFSSVTFTEYSVEFTKDEAKATKHWVVEIWKDGVAGNHSEPISVTIVNQY